MNTIISPLSHANIPTSVEEITLTRHTKNRMRKRRIAYDEIQVTIKYGTKYINRNGKHAYEYGGLMVVSTEDKRVITCYYVDGASWVGLHEEVVRKCERLEEANSQLANDLQSQEKERIAAEQKIKALRNGIAQALQMDCKNQMLLSHLSLINTNHIEEQWEVAEAYLPRQWTAENKQRRTGRLWLIREVVEKCRLLEEDNLRLENDLQNQRKGRHAAEQQVQILRYGIAHALKTCTKNEQLPSQLPLKMTNRVEARTFHKRNLTQIPIR